MFSQQDDEPNDPRRFRRTLVPLEIEDAEKPPSLARRLGRLFGKKRDKAGPESPGADRGDTPRNGPPDEPEKDTLPSERGNDGDDSGQDL